MELKNEYGGDDPQVPQHKSSLDAVDIRVLFSGAISASLLDLS